MSGFNGMIDANALHPSDVVNNLTSTATDKPLSAAQGKELNDKFTPESVTANCACGSFDQGNYIGLKFGKLVILSFQISVDTNTSAYSAIVNGIPNVDGTYMFNGYVTGEMVQFYVSGNGIYTRSEITSGKQIRLTVIYFAS